MESELRIYRVAPSIGNRSSAVRPDNKIRLCLPVFGSASSKAINAFTNFLSLAVSQSLAANQSCSAGLVRLAGFAGKLNRSYCSTVHFQNAAAEFHMRQRDEKKCNYNGIVLFKNVREEFLGLPPRQKYS